MERSERPGWIENPDKAYLDHLCRKGYVVIAPDHFVAGHRIPAAGPYDTAAFYKNIRNGLLWENSLISIR